MKLLEVKNLKKNFGSLEVIKDLSFSVEEGKVVGIIGPSGSGKSTLLRCISFLEKIDSGELLYMGESAVTTGTDGRANYAEKEKLRQIQRYFGLVFQNFNLFPHFSVIKNVTDAIITVQKKPIDEAMETGRELLDKMGLSDKVDAYPWQLSGGQQQRVSIARALATKPRMLFFDEPTSALDPELTGEILKVIRGLADDNMTMIIVTHEMNFAKNVADYIIFMDDGLIVEEGPPKMLFENPQNGRTQAFLNKFVS
ncbi:MAG: amino acid ABC transporter ATP-binding protein [Clostridiales bacterium]|nr:amino acid ABC transporter ATP-binding protein [Clostridiales bacterium]